LKTRVPIDLSLLFNGIPNSDGATIRFLDGCSNRLWPRCVKQSKISPRCGREFREGHTK